MVNLAILVPILVNGYNTLIIQIFYKIQFFLRKTKSGREFHKSPEFLTENVKNFQLLQ